MAGLGVALSVACGVQGPPKPPRIEQPQRVTDLTVAQVGRNLRFSFTLPRLAMDGERLTKPLEIEFLRATFAAGPPSPPPATALKTWMTLGPSDIDKRRRGDELTFSISLSKEDSRQSVSFYAVRTLTRGFRRRPAESELSNLVQLTLLRVPGPVQNLKVRTTEHAMELSWVASTPPATGYRVYRSESGKPETFVLRGDAHTTSWEDSEFKFGQTYSYKVTAIVKEGANVAESEDSSIVDITPRDTFPPAPPKGLTALYTLGAVELIWNASREPDLAGYNLYRRNAGGGLHKLNAEPLRTPIFRDASVEEGREYGYCVTALDLANNESPASEEVAVEAR